MSEDRILLTGMRFQARHGVHERERRVPQRFEVVVELRLDLGPAGRSDDLGRTVDYSAVYETVRSTVEGESFALIETLAETIAARVLVERRIEEVRVRVRKPEVELGGPL
ncbi:MAG TPA: dihydroneopterin aldolase, partial [Candidatus Dormibacteraeota bacterium]|nr:dihydroneopterin aldolase [Candidatus Dormibacteraeota bacterium]